jgi:hypothetical protein
METSRLKYYKGLFLLVAVYDIILGIIFMFFSKSTFELLGIPEKLPEFEGYLTLIGVYVLILGIAYYLIYRGNLQKNRDLILIGILYKLGYCAVTFYYFMIGNIPHILFLALFGVIDFIMFLLMLECYNTIGMEETAND